MGICASDKNSRPHRTPKRRVNRNKKKHTHATSTTSSGVKEIRYIDHTDYGDQKRETTSPRKQYDIKIRLDSVDIFYPVNFCSRDESNKELSEILQFMIDAEKNSSTFKKDIIPRMDRLIVIHRTIHETIRKKVIDIIVSMVNFISNGTPITYRTFLRMSLPKFIVLRVVFLSRKPNILDISEIPLPYSAKTLRFIGPDPDIDKINITGAGSECNIQQLISNIRRDVILSIEVRRNLDWEHPNFPTQSHTVAQENMSKILTLPTIFQPRFSTIFQRLLNMENKIKSPLYTTIDRNDEKKTTTIKNTCLPPQPPPYTEHTSSNHTNCSPPEYSDGDDPTLPSYQSLEEIDILERIETDESQR